MLSSITAASGASSSTRTVRVPRSEPNRTVPDGPTTPSPSPVGRCTRNATANGPTDDTESPVAPARPSSGIRTGPVTRRVQVPSKQAATPASGGCAHAAVGAPNRLSASAVNRAAATVQRRTPRRWIGTGAAAARMTRSGGTMWPMSASLLEYAPAVTGVVLLAVLLAGVLAGRSKSRWTALAGGIVLIFAAGVVLTAVGGGPENDDPAAELTALYTITLPLLIAFVAGWLLVRGGWLRRFLVIAIGAFLLVAFPYAAAGQATATAFLPGG